MLVLSTILIYQYQIKEKLTIKVWFIRIVMCHLKQYIYLGAAYKSGPGQSGYHGISICICFGLFISNIKFKYLCLLNYALVLLSLRCCCRQVWPQVQSSPPVRVAALGIKVVFFWHCQHTSVMGHMGKTSGLYICHSFRNVRLATHRLPSAALMSWCLRTAVA